MRKLEALTKKELINLIIKIRPKADAYDRVCERLGIENNILSHINKLIKRNKNISYLIEKFK